VRYADIVDRPASMENLVLMVRTRDFCYLGKDRLARTLTLESLGDERKVVLVTGLGILADCSVDGPSIALLPPR